MKAPLRDVVIALVVGLAVGWVAAERFGEPGPRHARKPMMERFSRELSLTPDQERRIRALMEAKREQFRALHEEVRPRFDQIRRSSKEEIRKVLTPEQAERFERMESEWQARRQKRRERWDGPRP
jgi:Spy/CpxP family protein refolding chaperone